MYINFDDERGLLSPEIKENIELAARIAIGSELFIVNGELEPGDEIEDSYFRDTFGKFNEPLEISFSVVSADEIKNLNKEYRGVDKVTDVLSFPQYESAEDCFYEMGLLDENNELVEYNTEAEYNVILGDVVLCYDKAISQAEEFETGIEREIVYLTIHSIFHLLGYDHMEDDDKRAMRMREECVLHAIGLGRD